MQHGGLLTQLVKVNRPWAVIGADLIKPVQAKQIDYTHLYDKKIRLNPNLEDILSDTLESRLQAFRYKDAMNVLATAKFIYFIQSDHASNKELSQFKTGLIKSNAKMTQFKNACLKNLFRNTIFNVNNNDNDDEVIVGSRLIQYQDFTSTKNRINSILAGPTQIIYSNDESAAKEVYTKFLKNNKRVFTLGMIYDTDFYDFQMSESIAMMPSKTQQLGELVALLSSPSQQITSTLTQTQLSLLHSLNTRISDLKNE